MAFYRLQDKSSTYAGPLDVLKKVVHKEGLLGLYVGMESTFWRYVTPRYLVPPTPPLLVYCSPRSSIDIILIYPRHFWWNGGFFGSIYQVRALLPKADVRYILQLLALYEMLMDNKTQSPQAQLANNFISGSIGGFVGTALNTP
jgi:solute carrier family 25 (mitochondrial 2-oxodicarboxylate transporter), member 21